MANATDQDFLSNELERALDLELAAWSWRVVVGGVGGGWHAQQIYKYTHVRASASPPRHRLSCWPRGGAEPVAAFALTTKCGSSTRAIARRSSSSGAQAQLKAPAGRTMARARFVSLCVSPSVISFVTPKDQMSSRGVHMSSSADTPGAAARSALSMQSELPAAAAPSSPA
eukprot:scaffold21153_cov116-Isochrysis_galbana.AAC.2